MYFQLTPPSISTIRAKLIIEKLSSFSHNTSSINIFATGRTHSGKTTLGNRLLGIDYFLSTGRQDCTKEINLIEFPSGLRYFDLPGVCGDDRLENYNRVALGMSQLEDFPVVDEVTLARYQENQSPSEDNLSISSYASLNFQPDLVYYLIAPDKQLTRGDRKYLRNLLNRHKNIIYVFNMFADKQTGYSYYATEANIEDVATQLLKVHQSVLKDDSKPAIVGVNCWTGEGISELLHQSKKILLGEKGLLFEQLIEYQQQRTPDEYVDQVKRELIRLYAHAACERPTGSDTCDQPLHKLCYDLFDFLVSLPVQSEQAENSIDREVNTIVDRVLSNPTEQRQSESLEDRLNYVIGVSHYILSEGIDSFNELIKTYIFEPKKQGYEQENKEFEEWNTEKESYKEQLNDKWNIILSGIEELSKINNSIESLEAKINNAREELQPRIEAHESRYFEILSRRQSLNSRFERFKERRDRYNSNVDKINRSSARLTYETEQSINKERDYLKTEINSIELEDSRIDNLVSNWQRENESIEPEKSEFNNKIDQYNEKIERRDRKRRAIQQKLKEHNELRKYAQDEINFWFEMLKAFDEDLNSLDEKISHGIDEMNVHIEEIRSRLSENYLEQFSSIEDAIDDLQEVINRCVDEMKIFHNQIFTFSQEINWCLFRLNINKMVAQVLQKTTKHYFDETGNIEYRGSNYHYFRQHGVAIGLALTIMALIGLEQEYEDFYNNLLRQVERLGDFPDHPAESQILSLLEFNINSLFDSSLEQVIRQAVL